MKNGKIVLSIFSIIFLSSISVQSFVVKLSDLHTMAKRSDVVIHGYVGEQNVERDRLGRLVTLTKVEVVDGLHGAKTGEVITIYQVGGEKNGLVMPLLGGHQYNFGDEIIFFGLRAGGAFVSYGAGQGKFDIEKYLGKKRVIEDLGSIKSVANNFGPNAKEFPPTPLEYSEPEIFKSEIQKMLATP